MLHKSGMASAFDLPECHPLRVAHEKSRWHRAEIESSKECGCFYCRKIFGPDQVVNWIDTDSPHAQQTALCPLCGIDSVIGSASGFEINERFLGEMHTVWFGENARK